MRCLLKKSKNEIAMNGRIFLFIIFVFFSMCDIFCQRQVTVPVHPLANYGPKRVSIDIDTIRSFVYYEMGTEVMPYPSPGYSIYTRSKDKFTDTIHTIAGLARYDLLRYNDRNQLLYRHEFDPLYPGMSYVREDYEYDENGLLIKIVVKRINHSSTPSEDILNEYTYDYSTVQMTENGYVFDGFEFELDQQGRLIFAKEVNAKKDYIEYSDGKKYLIGAVYYSYTDSSYSSFGFFQPGNMVLGMSDRWIETTEFFDENGNNISKVVKVSVDGINWFLWTKVEKEYVYSGDSGTKSDIAIEGKTNTIVSAHFGAIHIFIEYAAKMQIFDFSACLIKQQTLSAGENMINVPSGYYIIKVGNDSYKVFVR